ncbi:hypothetical protein GCM10017600_71500 [Streptosporangium carneum]|uniref:Uncharacterized protein n=1 Tax=Streptosporangium carneum TaxID=47481 RepID=A0A9W6I9R5_9ACTN|nr:hypothetical protein GCM10017600_71500 [Streptosporangium carneum]
MTAILVLLSPLFALAVWAAVFDWKQRRRRVSVNERNIGSAVWRTRRRVEAHGGYPSSPIDMGVMGGF